jgi:hypothetical protein
MKFLKKAYHFNKGSETNPLCYKPKFVSSNPDEVIGFIQIT